MDKVMRFYNRNQTDDSDARTNNNTRNRIKKFMERFLRNMQTNGKLSSFPQTIDKSLLQQFMQTFGNDRLFGDFIIQGGSTSAKLYWIEILGPLIVQPAVINELMRGLSGDSFAQRAFSEIFTNRRTSRPVSNDKKSQQHRKSYRN